ncbi:MAG: YbaK/EbsC family protein [Candidatus Woesearchaeota archaeon]|nr:MAG: YbaK/EbsC family protein [Candidatus Woesearchaeota archaeon]
MTPREKICELRKHYMFTLHEFSASVHSSVHSARASGIPLEKIVKTVLLEDKEERLFAVILFGKDLVDKNKIREQFSCSKLRLVPFEKVVKVCGFPAGGVPPFGFDATFIVDESLPDDLSVFVGGGDMHTLLEITVSEIKKACSPVVIKVKKEYEMKQ